MTSYSFVEAKGNMAKIVREAEQGDPVELMRDGQTVVVVLSMKEYTRLIAGQTCLSMLTIQNKMRRHNWNNQ